MAVGLIEDANSYSNEVKERQEQLRGEWNELLRAVDSRALKLHGAGEIHRFNRDVEDALSRIQEKYAAIPADHGGARDLKAVQRYMKKHESFENELVALEAQLQVLVDDSSRLQQTYPGGNAEQIAQQQAVVVDNWTILQEKSAQHKAQLLAAMDLYRFLAQVRDLMTWASEMETEMMTDTVVRDVHAAQMLRKRHVELKAEIDTRADSFSGVCDTGREMIDAGHLASNDIDVKVQEVSSEQDKLQALWRQRDAYLAELLSQQTFYRDAAQLDALSTAQEALLKGTDLGNGVEQVEALIKRQEAFDNLLTGQDQKVDALKTYGKQLIHEKNFDLANIGPKLLSVCQRRDDIKQLSQNRKQALASSLLYSQFNRDGSECEAWIDEKLEFAHQESFSNISDLYDKMHKLQKHQAFEAEIVANTDRIKQVQKMGDELIRRRHETSPEVSERVSLLAQRWQALLRASDERGKGLEEARDILRFNEEIDKAEAWMREKESLVAAGDTGRDYEHCQQLQKKVGDVYDGVKVDEKRIEAINKLADKLIRQGRTDTKMIEQKKNSLNERWTRTQKLLQGHRQKLSAALEVHAFNRDIDDINDRINEKICTVSAANAAMHSRRGSQELSYSAMAMQVDDYGKSVAGVQALQRKQDELERDMTALHTQIGKLETVASRLCRKYEVLAPQTRDKLKEAIDHWEKLEDLANARKIKLEDSHQLHKFLTDAKEHVNWCNNMMLSMKSGELAKDVLEAEEILEIHQERKAEINGRYVHYGTLKSHGDKLVADRHYAAADIERMLSQLAEVWLALNEAWEDRKQLLTQCYDLQVYEEYAEQADIWLANKEAFLANEDLGDSVSSVDTLMKKHEAFEKTLEAQEEKISMLQQLADALLAQQSHYAGEQIAARCSAVLARRDHVKRTAAARHRVLVDAINYQQFLRNVLEVMTWVSSKQLVASDEAYRDPTNLQAKLQKHQAFEAELTANKRRIDAATLEGHDLIEMKHFASTDIAEKLEKLDNCWRHLVEASQQKSIRLQETYQAVVFRRQCVETEQWMDEMETQLTSEDHGKDITTATNLLKKHQLLEEDIEKHSEKTAELQEAASNFRTSNHYLMEELSETARCLAERYESLAEPSEIRRDNLTDTLQLYQFYRDVDDELSWIRDKWPTAASDDLGSSLTAVQNLQKKHQVLESEIISHEPLIEEVASTASQMIAAGHYAHKDVGTRLSDLQAQLQQLRKLAETRRVKLLDALESQMFYAEVTEAELWINDKKPLLTSPDLGKDEDSVQALLKKMDALELDIENFSNNISELAGLCKNLVERAHFDSKNIQQQQSAIESKYTQLKALSSTRRHDLVEMGQLYEFLREADELEVWINEKEAVAASDDYGTDLEHVEILQQKFDDFMRYLQVSEVRVTSVTSLADTLVTARHTSHERIERRTQQITDMWAHVKIMADARLEALKGAKQVHAFIRDGDDAIDWIQEKDVIVSTADYGQDLQSVQALMAKHEGFEQDLAAISSQVDSITHVAEDLLKLYPEAHEHIASKHEQMVQLWNMLLDKAEQRKQKLAIAESLQIYFNNYRQLTAWCSEMMALVTSDELARDVSGAEAMLSRHREHRAEIDTRLKDFDHFTQTGQRLISEGHFLSDEIQGKIEHLNMSVKNLMTTWQRRQQMYEENLDLQQLKREMDQLDAWLNFRETIFTDDNVGDSIDAVEELLRRHADFEKTVEAQAEKFDSIKRLTLLEQHFLEQKQAEEEMRLAEEKARERERLEEKKRIEQDRILKERERDEEEKRNMEILLKRRQEIENADAERQQFNFEPASPSQLAPEEVGSLIRRSPSFRAKQTPIITTKPPSTTPKPKSPPVSPSNLVRSLLKPLRSDADNTAMTPEPVKSEKVARSLSLRTPRSKDAMMAKDKYKLPATLPPAELEGLLERKQDLQGGGKRATMRSWKTFYTVLCGQLLCFFKDKHAYSENIAAAPPLALRGATCEIAALYTKKKNVLRLRLDDGSEFLFMAQTQNVMVEWLGKIQFHAELPPAQQLMHYDVDMAAKLSQSLAAANTNQPPLPIQPQPALPSVAPPTPPSPTSSMASSTSSYHTPRLGGEGPRPTPGGQVEAGRLVLDDVQQAAIRIQVAEPSPETSIVSCSLPESPSSTKGQPKGKRRHFRIRFLCKMFGRSSISSHTPPPSPPTYTNGTPEEPPRTPGRSVSSTLPPGPAISPTGVSRTSSLDHRSSSESVVRVDKKRHSVFGGLFKKKKDKNSDK